MEGDAFWSHSKGFVKDDEDIIFIVVFRRMIPELVRLGLLLA